MTVTIISSHCDYIVMLLHYYELLFALIAHEEHFNYDAFNCTFSLEIMNLGRDLVQIK